MRVAELLNVVGRVWDFKMPPCVGRRRRAPQRRDWLEPLEVRALLSVVIASNGKSASYTDVDGDIVTVAVSKGTLDLSNFTTLATGVGDQLQEINLSVGGFDGANVNITVKKTGAGDGFANVGYIASVTHDLGAVTVPGDLGRINAGDATLTTPGVTNLKVRSMGRFGIDTQDLGTLVSNINALTSLSVTTDVVGAFLNISGSLTNGVTIGGSLIGGLLDDSGSIQAEGNIGNVKVTGSILGGFGENSGSIQATDGKMGTVTVGGSVLGGTGDSSGFIGADGDMGTVKISGDLAGGDGVDTGEVVASGKLASVTIGGSVLGGTGATSGRIESSGNMGAVKITGDIVGSSKPDTGIIDCDGDIASITVGGSVRGGTGDDSGELTCGGNMGAVKITGSLIGSVGNDSGEIGPSGNLASVFIGGDLVGGFGNDSGEIDPSGNCGAITINGSILGGFGNDSGEIDPSGTCGTVKVGRDVRGGSGSASGVIDPDGNLAGVTIGGSLVGGSGNFSGVIAPDGTLGAVSIGRDLMGGSVAGTGSLDTSGAIIATSTIKSVTIGGSLFAGTVGANGTLTKSGVILSDNDIQSITIKGSIVGNAGNNAIIAANGQISPSSTVDVAIGSLTVSGRVEYAMILGGYDTSLTAENDRAQINSIKITGDLIASSLVAGAEVGIDGVFGTDDDVFSSGGTPVAAINSISIGGQVFGTPNTVSSADHFGFVARRVKSVKIGSVSVPVTSADDTDVIEISVTTGDFTIREV